MRFRAEAKKEWDALGATIRRSAASSRRNWPNGWTNPHVPSARLHGSQNRYKIKLWAVGYRLVYEVRDAELVVSVIAVGKRDRKGLRI